MTIDLEKLVREFHNVYGVPIKDYPTLPEHARRDLRIKLLKEEFQEYLDAEQDNNIHAIADGLIDLVYIAIGTCLEYGIPFNSIFREVHMSNMSKLDDKGDPIKREDGKVLKGPSYFKPRIPAILNMKKLNYDKRNEK